MLCKKKRKRILEAKMTLIYFLHLLFNNSIDILTLCPITPIWHAPQRMVKLAVSV